MQQLGGRDRPRLTVAGSDAIGDCIAGWWSGLS
jgi:hypothetical protein